MRWGNVGSDAHARTRGGSRVFSAVRGRGGRRRRRVRRRLFDEWEHGRV